MLAAGLQKGTFDARLALAHLTPEVLAEHLSPPLVWRCLAEAAARNFHVGDARAHASETLARAAASMSAAKLDAMVVRQSPVVTRKLPDDNSWEQTAMVEDAVVEEEVIEETSPGQLPPAP